MNASEDRQLEAEADAYQMEADARRERDMAMCGLQSEILILRERLRKMTETMWAWERTARYERAARTRLQRSIEFHKLATPMSGPMLDDLASAIALAEERWADAERHTPRENA